MGDIPEIDPKPLRSQPSNISASSTDSASTLVPSPIFPLDQRPAFHRIPTLQVEDLSEGEIGVRPQAVNGSGERIPQELEAQCLEELGKNVTSETGRSDSKDSCSVNPPLRPSLARCSNKRSYWSPEDIGKDSPEDIMQRFPFEQSSPPTIYTPFEAESESEGLRRLSPPSRSDSYQPTGLNGDFTCRTIDHFHHSRGNWLSVTILILSVYSTIFSGIWFMLAVLRPRYGTMITDSGALTPSTASLLCAALAKTIELSFVTVFITFLGQVLSLRAFKKSSRGVTIAEMQMRAWIMQPGTMITHVATLRYAALTFLGMIALTAALMATLYTTASDALVAPKLKFGKPQDRLLYGKVATTFFNEQYIQDGCITPISAAIDPEGSGETCIAIEHLAQSYHNYAQYLAEWAITTDQKNGSSDLAERPPPVGLLFDNTTVRGSWVDVQDMSETSSNFGRVVNTVSMAMPLSAIFSAARAPHNAILQPQDLDGLGEYYVQASVPAPSINVLCASMTEEELAPMVLSKWPGFNGIAPNETNYPSQYDIPVFPSWLNTTVVDDLFGLGQKYGRRPPVFPKIPEPYNTVLNISSLETDSLYVLATSANSSYMLCSMRAYLSPKCSTEYHASLSGGSLSTQCDAPNDSLSNDNTETNATIGVYSADWVGVATPWAKAISLDIGIIDGDASNSRLMSQLIPTAPSLDPSLPSIAEALAVLAGCTLLNSGIDAPFVFDWNYSTPILDPPQYQALNATLRFQDYSSGGTARWQSMLYAVLALVLLANLFCLGYFLTHAGLVTDFMEPQNLFALSLNSPPSQVLEGTCGGGPEGKYLKTSWFIRMSEQEHFYVESADLPPSRPARKKRRAPSEMEIAGSPVAEMYGKLSTRAASLL